MIIYICKQCENECSYKTDLSCKISPCTLKAPIGLPAPISCPYDDNRNLCI